MISNQEIISILNSIDFSYNEMARQVDFSYNLLPKNGFSSADTGAFKYCLIPNNGDYVIKFPRKLHRDLKKNICQQELNFYHNSFSYGIQSILLKTEYLTTINNVPFYKQQRIDYTQSGIPPYKLSIYRAMTKKVKSDLINKIQNSIDNFTYIEELWLKMAVLIYGKKFMLSFEKWVRDNNVTDLHGGNIGYLNDKPVILDFCGTHLQ